MRLTGAVLVLSVLVCEPALGHDLQYAVEEGEAVSVALSVAGEKAFSFAAYEIYRAGEDRPFQVGRTDRHGRLVFLPDRQGEWRIKVFSEDGHGVDVFITTDARGGVEHASRPAAGRTVGIAAGVALIFGLFGVVWLVARRRTASV